MWWKQIKQNTFDKKGNEKQIKNTIYFDCRFFFLSVVDNV